MSYTLLNNDLTTWATVLGCALGVALALYLVKRVLISRLGKFAAHTSTFADDLSVKVLAATHPLCLLAVGLYIGAQWLALTPRHQALLLNLVIAAVLLQVARWGDAGVHGWLHHYRIKRTAQDAASTTSTAALGFVVRAGIWLVIILMILDNFGVNITTLIASLGIGGIAVALAIQNILGDLFSSLSIVLDKPFVVGDFITVDDIAGTVEYVGLKTTRVRALGGEQIIFSNSDLLKSRIRNLKRMQSRRIVFGIGVTYEVAADQLERIPAMLRAIVEAQPKLKFDRAHFKAFGPSSLDFEVVYIVETADYGVYMDSQQAINLALFKRFQDEGIEFAYPTQTVHLAHPEALPWGAQAANTAETAKESQAEPEQGARDEPREARRA